MAEDVMTEETKDHAGLFEADAVKDGGVAVYEIGYHLVPTHTEDEAAAAAKDLMNFLKKEGASFVGEKVPTLLDLAYSIEKRIQGRLTHFTTAYFGWIAFEIEPRTLETVQKFLDTNPSVLRYLLVSTTKEEVTAVLEGAVIMPKAVASTEAIAAPKRAQESGAAVSDEALSKALETMAEEDEGKKPE